MEQKQTTQTLNLRISSQIVSDFIEIDLFSSIWQGIAEKNVNRMAPECANLQYRHIIESFVLMSINEANSLQYRKEQSDPKPVAMDSLAANAVHSKSPEKDKNIEGGSRKMSKMSRRLSTHKSSLKYPKGSEASVELKKGKVGEQSFCTKVADVQEEILDPVEEKHRAIRNRKERDAKETVEFLKNKEAEVRCSQQKSEIRAKKNEKLIKDLKKYTFNYYGELQKVTNPSGLERPTYSKMRSGYSHNTLVPKDIPKLLSDEIQNDRLSARKTKAQLPRRDKFMPIFNEDGPKSIMEVFNEKYTISEGVRLIETINHEKLTKETPAKPLLGFNKYHLTQFKDFSKEIAFKKHQHVTKRNSQTLNPPELSFKKSNKPNSKQLRRSEKSLNAIESNPQDHQLQGYGALPSLKGGLKTRSRSMMKSSERSLDYSVFSKRSELSKINIDSEDLFHQNFVGFNFSPESNQ